MSEEPSPLEETLSGLEETELERRKMHLRRERDLLLGKRHLSRFASDSARSRLEGTARAAFSHRGLERRLEEFFSAVRESKNPWPIEETLRVFDQFVAQIVSRRVLLVACSLFAGIPAVLSLVFLAKQNADLTERLETVEQAELHASRDRFREVIYRTHTDDEGNTVPSFHRRLRTEAISSMVEAEKRRWDSGDILALPPTKYVHFPDGEFAELVISDRIGVAGATDRRDMTRTRWDGSNLSGAAFFNVRLDGVSLNNTNATGLMVDSPSARFASFENMKAPGSRWGYYREEGAALMIEDSNLRNARLDGALFENIFFIRCQFDGASLQGIDGLNLFLKECDLTKANLGENPDWSWVVLQRCLLTEAQAESILLPPVCTLEPGPESGTVLVRFDPSLLENTEP
ncbi:MAG: pentapeptide repeat-containing protein [Verrucomicrobiota bacterium]